jgi:hypothetical protein
VIHHPPPAVVVRDVHVRADRRAAQRGRRFSAHALVVRFTRAQLRAAGVFRPDGPLAVLLAP